MSLDDRLIEVRPAPRQVALQELEFYAFVHFSINTFTDREWGDGREDPALFNPTRLDPDQWARAIRAAGMRGLILTCKHHDGFCLWPSAFTDHSVAASPYPGDVVRETAAACRRHGLRFGVYLSPWDRHSPLYGQGKAYDDYFVQQLTELLTGYGEIFTVWLDGACGEGPNGRRQVYDWARYYETIRRLQPQACINVCGPDVRWCGNEAGSTRPSEWSVVPARTRDTEKIADASQQADDGRFRLRKLSARDRDLGSRDLLRDEPSLVWYPAEVDLSIRPGWFWHEAENGKLRSLEELVGIYIRSVGGNATMLLNIPPTREGRLHEADVRRLEELGRYLRRAFSDNLAEDARFRADSCRPGCEAAQARVDGYETFYQAEEGWTDAVITAEWDEPAPVGYIVLKENILLSQRIERFSIEARTAKGYREVYSGTVVGYKRIVPLSGVTANGVRVRIADSRREPTLSFLGIYRAMD